MQILRDLKERSQRFPRSFSTCVVGVRGPQNKDFPSKTTRSLQDTPERGGAEAESSAAARGSSGPDTRHPRAAAWGVSQGSAVPRRRADPNPPQAVLR